jgi:chromosome segregation ATPase
MDELKLQPRHSEDEEASSSSPSTEKFRSLTKRELYIAVLAALIGFTFGVSTFALSFGRRVSLSLEDWEIQHIHTMDDLRDRLELVTREKKECLEDDTQGLELAELRGKLTARSTLMRRVEELIEETRLREQEYFELQDTIERQTTEMEMSSKAKDQLTERMGRLSQQRSELTRQLKGLNRQVHELTTQVDDYQVQTTRYQDRIRQRESFLCKEV